MNKVIKILLGIVLLIGILLLGSYLYLLKAVTPDPNYNTRYTADYSDKKFNSIKNGDPLDKVISVLGKPIRRDTLEYIETYIYSNAPDHIIVKEGITNGGTFTGGFDSLNYIFVSFNKKGEVKYIVESFENQQYDVEGLKALDKEQIIDKMGIADIEMKCECECEVLSFSKLKEGPYRGKNPIIDKRKIAVINNRVINKISKEGNPYNPYIGTCNINRN